VRHLDLFSGIGGFALAVDEVWPGSEHIFCEIDTYCQILLKKRFKGARIYGDIRSLSRERLIADTDSRGQTEQELKTAGDKRCDRASTNAESGQSGQSQAGNKGENTRRGSEERIDILTGGFPCQPFSQAGKRKGTSDNRFLWPEMLRVIREFKPTWVIAENVRGILSIEQGMVFEQVCLDLEGEGYEVQPFIIPAVAVNAPHRRDRVWFVAHSRLCGCGGPKDESKQQGRTDVIGASKDSNAPDTESGSDRRYERKVAAEGQSSCGSTSWQRNWLEVATELCGVDDGLPAEVDGLKLSKARHRVERLKALGNAIVPHVAVEIMRAIKYTEEIEEGLWLT
jgi:DNA (cytosine-5)-methyltransferase 1